MNPLNFSLKQFSHEFSEENVSMNHSFLLFFNENFPSNIDIDHSINIFKIYHHNSIILKFRFKNLFNIL